MLSIVLLLMAGCSNSSNRNDIIKSNNIKIIENVNNTTSDTVSLGELVTFEWENVYIFAPYTLDTEILKTIGLNFDVKPIYSGGTNQIVFIRDNQVICYLSGYPDDNGVLFEFDFSNAKYLQFSSTDRLEFEIQRDDAKAYTVLKHKLD